MPRKEAFWWRDPAEKERRREYMKVWSEKNKERKKQLFANWREKNVERDKTRCLEWQKKNPARTAAGIARRKASKLQRTPKWADHEAIAQFYIQAKEKTAATGVPHEVDHYYPLLGKTVSGLHTAENLRVITKVENRSKGNRV